MITIDQLNQLKHTANGALDGDGEGRLVDMLEQLLPYLPPMVGLVVSEFLREYNQPTNPQLTLGDLHDERPDFPGN